MPIKSYLAHPITGMKNDLIVSLTQYEQCEVIPAENNEVVILITDTQDDTEEHILKEKIEAIPSLKLLAMVSGFNTTKN
ncbi:hypothetical protein AWE51_06690 [Aquimarina aggregata]|uniref:Uncharacterized protein n=1 Tax=Aquimarina aggregata TaxID=1642818 RepID=A0A163ALI7_9FLAO|nr:hypothetical protein [Aquimarina aggregata]KZS40631.1 hypothetical protein AWE51_06690 [Aquimarina aggregata]